MKQLEKLIIEAKILTEPEAEVERVMQVCNACRYCEGFCAVFPAMTRRLAFEQGAEDALGLAQGVDIGVIEAGDADLQGRIHGGVGLLQMLTADGLVIPTAAKAHAAEDEAR